ncbi:MAG: hypothetical protein WC916_06775 [Candidatus Woesearchaeota archaeon]
MNPSIISGWDIPKKAYLHAHQNNQLIKVVMELSNICNKSCAGCFTKKIKDSWTTKSKKRLPNEQPLEIQLAMIDEAYAIGARTVDIVGAGEPTLDPNFQTVVEYITNKKMHAIIFTLGEHSALAEYAKKWSNKPVSFFIKFWSKNPQLQNSYVADNTGLYTMRRDAMIEKLILLGYTKGATQQIDGTNHHSTRLGADILVMKSNYAEIPELFRFCRENNIMPEIKSYIPAGPTHLSQMQAASIYTAAMLNALKKDEVTPKDMYDLRKNIINIDSKEFNIPELPTCYIQGPKCTQSVASLYITITGEIRSCVGTSHVYGTYIPEKNMLAQTLQQRIEQTSFGCIPRLIEAELKKEQLPQELRTIYEDGKTNT